MGLGLLLIASAAAVGGLFLFFNKGEGANGNTLATGQSQASALEAVRQHVAELDSDNDGLPDWEETLWHTDPKNPDTDGDGTKDGTEVSEGRDPTRPGPNDLLDTAPDGNNIAGTSSTIGGTNATTSLTDAASKEFFGSYLAMKQAGNLTEVNQQKLFQQVTADVQKQINLTPYTLSDLTVVATTPATTATYRAKYIAAITKVGAVKKNDLVVALQTLQENNPQGFAELASSSKIYGEATEDLLAIPVPKDIAEQHLAVVNGMRFFTDMTAVLSIFKTDPLKAVAYIGQYEQITNQVTNAATTIVTFVGTSSASTTP